MQEILTFYLPIQTISPNRTRGEHWSKTHKRKRSQTQAAFLLSRNAGVSPRLRPLPQRIRLVRSSTRLLDSDNLAASLKGVQDGVAAALDIDDGKLKWEYDQHQSPSRGLFGVRVELLH